jgi:hypothetical protein
MMRGLDAAPLLRPGDISQTGIYFETTVDPGPMGSVQTLSIAAEDGSHEVSLLAQLVRRVTTQDLWKGQVFCGAAFRFMAETEERQKHLAALVQFFLARAVGGETSVQSANAAARSVVHKASGVVVIEATWGLAAGEEVRLVLEAPGSGRSVEVHAQVATSTPMVADGGALVRTTLRLGGAPKPQAVVAGDSMFEALDALMDRNELEPEPPQAPQEHLSGVVSVVSLSGLVSFLEIQRMNGVLTVTRGDTRAFVHVRDGRLVDLEQDGAPALDPVAAAVEVLSWQDGSFEFIRDDSPRQDRMGRPTMELLLEAARLQDEASREEPSF